MSKLTIDELEVLTPDRLGDILRGEVCKNFPHVQVIQDLLDVGAPIDSRYKNGWTALHVAAFKGHLEVVKLLVSKGGDVNIRDNDYRTAWDVAGNGSMKLCPELRPKYD